MWTSVSPWCAAEVRSDADTLCRIELSSSLLADHSLAEYKEALDTLAVRHGTNNDAAGAPRVEVSGTLEWQEAEGLQYSMGMGRWTAYTGCYILVGTSKSCPTRHLLHC